jgi:hypothetical protein
MRLRDRLTSLCGHPRLPLIAGLLAIALTLPSLGFGLLADDWTHRAKLLEHPALERLESPIQELFVFFDGSHEEYVEGAELGALPWWTAEGLKASFWRPIAALTHKLDVVAWPDAFWLMHAHSLLWFGLAVGLVGLAFRQLGGLDGRSSGAAAVTAGLAALLFAVEDSHAMAASWIANRNASMSLAFGIVALLAHHRWRQTGWTWGPTASAAALAAGLLSGELALATTGYLFGYALFLDPAKSLAKRLLSLVPAALVCAAWVYEYRAGGYGTWGALSYVDPLSLHFPQAMAERIPLLLAAQWLQLPSDLWIAVPRGVQVGFTAASLAVTVGLGALLWPVLKERAEARFWATGMLLSLPPVCASFPMDRLLIFAGVGAFGLLALAVERAGLLGGEARGGRWFRRGVGALLVLHLLAAPLLPVKTLFTKFSFQVFAAAADAAPADEALREQQLVMVNGAGMMTGFLLMIRYMEDRPAPQRTELLAHMLQTLEISRRDATTILVRDEAGWIANPAAALMRSPKMPFERGETFERGTPDLGRCTVVVEELTDDGRPRAVSFDFHVPLEDPSLRWVVWTGEGLVDFEVPALGETTRVEVVWPWL